MQSSIRQWPSLQFYDDKLEDGMNIKERQELLLPKEICPYSFIHVDGKETFQNNSRKNENEAGLVVKLIGYLEKVGFTVKEDVGIISFYSGQVELLNQLLGDAKLPIQSQTVDGFQGEEKDIIIISFVRANNAGKIGFLDDFRRLNVAVTRAKRCLIMIGNYESLSYDENHIGSMMKHLLQNHRIQSETVVEKLISIDFQAKDEF